MSWTPLKRGLRQGRVSTATIKGDAASEWSEGLVPAYSASGQDVWLPRATHRGPGLILSAVGARCGKVFLADGAWAVVANTAVLEPQPGHSPKYLWYVVNNEDFWEKGGTAQPYVRVPETLARLVYLPDESQQRAIADYLDAETARIDALISKKRRMIELLDERYWRSFESALAAIPTSATTLRRVVDRISDGPFGSSLTSSHYATTGARVVRLGNIGLGRFKDDDKAFISMEHHRSLARHSVQTGDLLIAGLGDTANHVGRACVAPPLGPAIVKADCYCALVNRQRALPEFLALFLSSPTGAREVAKAARGTTRSRINLDIAKEVTVLLPDLPTQFDIVRRSDGEREALSRAAAKLNRQLRLLAEHRQALITAAVTGELDNPGAA